MRKPPTNTRKPLSLIVALDEDGGFGKRGKIPWHYPGDMKHFREKTKGSACIMGRVTYEDMVEVILARKKIKTKGDELVPLSIDILLPDRECYVVSKTLKKSEGGAIIVPNIAAAVEHTKKKEIFVIGGRRIWIESLPFVNKVYLTMVKGRYGCDVFFPIDYITKHFKIVNGEEKGDLKFIEYWRK